MAIVGGIRLATSGTQFELQANNHEGINSHEPPKNPKNIQSMITAASLLMPNIIKVERPVERPTIANTLNTPYLSASQFGIGRPGSEAALRIETWTEMCELREAEGDDRTNGVEC